ncbi:MAG TPA: tRNA guanosine(34) transglycosylase Tgt [Planctomycetes bacterium]|nr:tRNA guanosine(34) transglycosylase Tgt [Planctomycetota bacterium]
MPSLRFELVATATESRARAGVLHTAHGAVPTPLFMPVGTRGAVRGVLPTDLAAAGSRVLLANTFHLSLRPGSDIVERIGGLHALMGWDGPILTDSGGYQVFSLSDHTVVDEDGATLRSPVDGAKVRLTPERVMRIQSELGPDIAMAFDHCPADPHDREQVARATDRTHRWLERCVRAWREGDARHPTMNLFGIVQGGAFDDLRTESVEATLEHDLPGYAIGGVSVGEDRPAMMRAVEVAAPLLPEDKPRYLMGVGTPLDFLDAVERGIDMFDCVTPTRHGRNHQAFTSLGRINVRNQCWREDTSPLDPDCDCIACTRFHRASLRYLCTSGEMLGGILVSLHNLRFFHRLLADIRAAILDDRLRDLRARFEEAQRKRR